MEQFLNKLEKKIGRYAIPHLTAVMIACYVIGYIMQGVNTNAAAYMSLNIYAILHGQIWRIVTWILIPPSDFDILTIIMLLFYLSIGTALEKVWGDFRYNVYIIGGMLISLIAAFVTYFAVVAGMGGSEAAGIYAGNEIGLFFTTYYICLSMLLAYAATFPDATVYLFFVIPVKMKWLGIIYGAFIIYEAVTYLRYVGQSAAYIIPVVAIAASLLNFLIFFLSSRKRIHLTAEQRRRRREFRRASEKSVGKPAGRASESGGVISIRKPRHRCEVCGRTDLSNPELEFRYCSKCAGSHEYCMDHLYTHRHITADEDKTKTFQ